VNSIIPPTPQPIQAKTRRNETFPAGFSEKSAKLRLVGARGKERVSRAQEFPALGRTWVRERAHFARADARWRTEVAQEIEQEETEATEE
jgi:hypothetical protein